MQRRDFLLSLLAAGPASVACAGARGLSAPLRIAAFQADVTPPLGSPLSLGNRPPAGRIIDRLSARGIVLLGHGPPIVLCAVDWRFLLNEAHDAWRAALAKAVGTSADRVAVHTVHNHDAVGVGYSAEETLAAHGLSGKMFHVASAKKAMERVAEAAGEAAARSRPVTHLGYSRGEVEKVASTRRVVAPDGKLAFWRSSRGRDDRDWTAPEGLIDPYLRLLSFWDGDEPLVAINYYACHPCSYYGRGDVSADFVGMARAGREAALPGVAQIYFSGAGGDIACGKYNDGSTKNRAVLAARLERGMKLAWDGQKKAPVTAADVDWQVAPVNFPLSRSLDEKGIGKVLDDPNAAVFVRVLAAVKLAWIRRAKARHKVESSCLRIGPAYVLNMPGELFVEYQLAAQKMRPDAFVCMAAYGDLGPLYVGTKIAYSQGGYEVGMSLVAPEVEDVLMAAMGDLLDVEERPPVRPSDIWHGPGDTSIQKCGGKIEGRLEGQVKDVGLPR